MSISLTDLITITGAQCFGIANEFVTSGINTDTRTLMKGQVFLALIGNNFNGHDFVAKAIDLGASAAIVNYAIPNVPCLVVPDTLQAYHKIARWWRQQFTGTVIGVTGSAGKTTTKELIAYLLDGFCSPGKSVHKNVANYNNDIGVAKTILEINPDRHAFVVVEMGMRGLGEISRLATIAAPQIGVITNIGTAHIGRLGSQEAIASAKCELLGQLPSDGIALLNGEDQFLQRVAQKVWQGKALTYGINQGDLRGKLQGETIEVNGINFRLPFPGRHNAMNFLAALAVTTALGFSLESAAHQLAKEKPILELPEGRSHHQVIADQVQLLDESYNASPEATIAALEMLATSPNRRWAILGTMKELGEHSRTLHRMIGEKVTNLGIECLIVLCDGESDAILETARSVSQTFACHDQDEMCKVLLENVQFGDTLLFKASRSVGLENLVKSFTRAWNSSRH